jgi:hypothetical protein
VATRSWRASSRTACAEETYVNARGDIDSRYVLPFDGEKMTALFGDVTRGLIYWHRGRRLAAESVIWAQLAGPTARAFLLDVSSRTPSGRSLDCRRSCHLLPLRGANLYRSSIAGDSKGPCYSLIEGCVKCGRAITGETSL